MQLEAYHALAFIGGISAFLLVLSLWVGVVLFVQVRRSRQAQQIAERLGLAQNLGYDDRRVLRLWREGEYVSTVVPYRTLRGRITLRIEQMREAMGWNISLTAIGSGLLLIGFVAFIAGTAFTANIPVGLAAGVGAMAIPFMLVKRRINHQTQLFEAQLTDALSLAARSLRSGHPLEGAFRLISEEMNAPVSTVFAEIVQQQELGLSMEEAIRQTAARFNSHDLDLFASSVVIQLKGGGNLAEMFERLAEVVRGRIRLHRRAKVLTSQTQLSKRILIAVPILLFAGLALFNPEYAEPLISTFEGNMLLLVAFVMLGLGALAMNRLAQLRV